MASGHVSRIKRPNTWLHRPMLQNVKKALANSEPSTHGAKPPFAGKQHLVTDKGIGRKLSNRATFKNLSVTNEIGSTQIRMSYRQMRVVDRDLTRGGHYGQRSCEPHLKAEHMAAPTKPAT